MCTHDDGMISSSFLSFREKDLDRFFKGYGRKTDVLIKQVNQIPVIGSKVVCNVIFHICFFRALDLLSLKIIATLTMLFMNSMAKTFWEKGRRYIFALKSGNKDIQIEDDSKLNESMDNL